jgi:hypothetical protein
LQLRKENFRSALDAIIEQAEARRLPVPRSFARCAHSAASATTAVGLISPRSTPSAGSISPRNPREILIETPRLKISASP